MVEVVAVVAVVAGGLVDDSLVVCLRRFLFPPQLVIFTLRRSPSVVTDVTTNVTVIDTGIVALMGGCAFALGINCGFRLWLKMWLVLFVPGPTMRRVER